MKRSLSLSLVVLTSLAGAVGCSQPVGEEVQDVGTTESSIVGGTEAQPGAWPGVVAVISGGEQVCGGTLVADQWVVTAAHCVEPGYGANGGIDGVLIGRHALRTPGGEGIVVDRAYQHPGFDMSVMENDIALLHLKTKSKLAHVNLTTAAQESALSVGAAVTVVGWGMTSERSYASSNVLRQVTVPIVSIAQCNAAYRGYGQLPSVSNDQICAGFPQGGKDSCQGDSGGPLFMNIDGQPTQVGVVSWGIGCARASSPGVYTRVAKYLDWLSQRSNGEIVTSSN